MSIATFGRLIIIIVHTVLGQEFGNGVRGVLAPSPQARLRQITVHLKHFSIVHTPQPFPLHCRRRLPSKYIVHTTAERRRCLEC